MFSFCKLKFQNLNKVLIKKKLEEVNNNKKSNYLKANSTNCEHFIRHRQIGHPCLYNSVAVEHSNHLKDRPFIRLKWNRRNKTWCKTRASDILFEREKPTPLSRVQQQRTTRADIRTYSSRCAERPSPNRLAATLDSPLTAHNCCCCCCLSTHPNCKVTSLCGCRTD